MNTNPIQLLWLWLTEHTAQVSIGAGILLVLIGLIGLMLLWDYLEAPRVKPKEYRR